MKKEAENAWHYLKYSEDCKKLQHLVNLVISEQSPRYIRNLPEVIYELAARIVEYKIRRADLKKIDSYFDE